MIVSKLFDEFNRKKVRYCVLRKYKNLPSEPEGDIDLFIDKKDTSKAKRIINSLGFTNYPYVEPHYFYFCFDEKMIILDVIFGNLNKEIKKYNNFYVPNKWGLRVRKTLIFKIQTYLRRKAHYIGNGKLICFIGPDGCGKTTTLENVMENLKEFPIPKKRLKFSKTAYSKVKRTFDLIYLLLKVESYLFLGNLVLCDRYLYMTFREKKLLRRILLKVIRKPDKAYFLTNKPDIIFSRKKELGLSDLDEQINFFSGLAKQRKEIITLPTNPSEEDVSSKVTKDILKLYK